MHDLVTATVTVRRAQPADSVCVEGGRGMVLCAGSGGEATVDHDPKVANTTRRWSLSRSRRPGLGCLSKANCLYSSWDPIITCGVTQIPTTG